MNRKYRVISLLVLVLFTSLLIPVTNTYTLDTNTNSVFKPRVKLGGGLVRLKPSINYDPVTKALSLMVKTDRDNDFLEDYLEENISSRLGNESVNIIVWWAVKSVAFGVDAKQLWSNLYDALSIVRELGGRITKGPWIHAIVGFAATVRIDSLKILVSKLSQLDIDGDGKPDRFEINLDKTYRLYNYWSSRQMGIRPWVWENLGVNGINVTVVVIDSGIDGSNSAFAGKIIYWKDYVGDSSGTIHDTPYDDHMHGTHVAGTIAGYYASFDDQGRLVFNFGLSDLDWSNAPTGVWLRLAAPYMAYYVNSTGTITLEFMWKSDTTATSTSGTISEVGIGFCGNVTYNACSGTIVASTTTPNANTWYTVSYDITSSSQFGWYYVSFKLGQAGGLAFIPIIHVPVSHLYTTKIPYLAGMAPGAMLGGAKVMSFAGTGSTSDIVSAINDVVANRTTYNPPLYIISMSLGGSYDSALEDAVTNAVNAGIVAVVAAGNDGTGNNYAGTGSPSANPYAITVAAVDAFFNITDYSSQGGPSQDDSSVIKPDIAAPGGGNVLMIFSADTTWHDDLSNAVQTRGGYEEDIDWNDIVNTGTRGHDDSIGISGTSMATPHVSGAAALVIDALTNHVGLSWDWNNAGTALLVKNILLMSSVETYPLIREAKPDYSPSLDKGDKDIHEGYGALDAYAAVKIALSYGEGRALLPGSVVEDRFRDGVLYGGTDFNNGIWRFPFGHSAWGNRIVFPYTSFTLSNGSVLYPVYGLALYPNTSTLYIDLDLYLYSITGNNYGEPVILAKSTNGFGYDEKITVSPHDLGISEAVVVAKRAREDSSGGPWLLSFGPWMKITGLSPDYTQYEDQAWIGWPVTVEVMSAIKAVKAVIEFYDNTTGTLLNKTVITLTDQGAYSYGSLEYVLPFDKNLVGHQLVVIVSLQDSSGNIVTGPIYSVAIINDAPQPVPEYTGIVVSGIILVVVAVIIYWKKLF